MRFHAWRTRPSRTSFIDRLHLLLLVASIVTLGASIVLAHRARRLRRVAGADAARVEAILAGVGDAIIWCDARVVVVSWNEAAARLFGSALAAGVPFPALVDDDSRRAVLDALERFVGGTERRREITAARAMLVPSAAEGAVRIEATAWRTGAIDAGFALIVRNVSGLDALEGERARADRLGAIDQLTHGIAHDFNNMLTTIAGRAEMALQHVRAGAPGRSDLEEVRIATTRAAAVARRLLTLSRDQELQPRILDVNGVVKAVEPTLVQLAGSASVTVELAPDAGSVNADPTRLHEVLLALAQHALDAVRARRGHVTVRTLRSLEPLHASGAPTDAGNDFAVIEVVDDGPGTDEVTRARAFEPYFATTGARAGHGLELASAYAFARQSGGTIEMQTAPGRGTLIRVLLPRVPDDADRQRAGRLIPADEPHRPTVLVVEDEESVRLFVRVVLEKHGYRVLQAANGVEALRLLDDPNVTVDALLTDVMMPQMGGRELAERMLAVQPDVHVIFMSGYVADRALMTGVAERRAPLLQKPFSLDEMVRVVRESIGEPAHQ